MPAVRGVLPLASLLLLGVTLVACFPGARAPSAPEGPPPPPPVVLERGATTSREERAAAALVLEARAALERGALESARASAATVVERHAATRASGEAAWLLARALAGLRRPLEAEAALVRYVEALPPGDDRVAEARLLQADLLEEAGDPAAALDRLLRLPATLPETSRREALERVRRVVPRTPPEALESLLASAGRGQPLAVPLLVAHARGLLLSGEVEEARRHARAALDAGAAGPEREAAVTVLEGGLPGGEARPLRLGAVLPLSGSPALSRFARGIEEGMRAALAAEGLEERVELLVRDDRGEETDASEAVLALEALGAVAVVGPLPDASLARAAAARRSALPLLSPTAVELPVEERAVYSLGAVDAGAPRALAAYAASRGIRTVAVLHATTRESETEATLFAEAFRELGGSVLRRVAYPPGTTYFEEQLEAVAALGPDALVLPVPPEDIPTLAPQVTFFGLDARGIDLLGTAGWTVDEVVRGVSPRHTDGVVAATPHRPGEEPPGHRRFVDAYEARFRRSLRDPVTALGWDAASLLLLALKSGARTREELASALERVAAFPGATGVLSVHDGRVVREHHLVCLRGQRVLPLVQAASGWRVGDAPPADEALPAPEGSGRPCPGESVPDTVTVAGRRGVAGAPARLRPHPAVASPSRE